MNKKNLVFFIFLCLIPVLVFSFWPKSGITKISNEAGEISPPEKSEPEIQQTILGKVTSEPDREDVINTEFQGQIGKAPEIYRNSNQALIRIKSFLKDGNSSVLNEFTAVGDDCSWCGTLYRQVGEMLSDSSTPPQEQLRLAMFLSISESTDALNILLDLAAKDPDLKPGSILYETIAKMPQRREIVEAYSRRLEETSNIEFRKALVGGLGQGHSLQAAKQLYQDLVRNNDTEGFSNLGIGIAGFKADDQALEFIKEAAGKNDKFSQVFLISLLQSGNEGADEAVRLIENINDREKRLAVISFIKKGLRWRSPDAYEYMRELSKSRPELEELAKLN